MQRNMQSDQPALPNVSQTTQGYKNLIARINGVFDALTFMMFFVLRVLNRVPTVITQALSNAFNMLPTIMRTGLTQFWGGLLSVLGQMAALESIIHFGVALFDLFTDRKIGKESKRVEFKKYRIFQAIRTGYTAFFITAAINAAIIAAFIGVTVPASTISLVFLSLLSFNSAVNLSASYYYRNKAQKYDAAALIEKDDAAKKRIEEKAAERHERAGILRYVGLSLGLLATASGVGFVGGFALAGAALGVPGCLLLAALPAGLYHYVKDKFKQPAASTLQDVAAAKEEDNKTNETSPRAMHTHAAIRDALSKPAEKASTEENKTSPRDELNEPVENASAEKEAKKARRKKYRRGVTLKSKIAANDATNVFAAADVAAIAITDVASSLSPRT